MAGFQAVINQRGYQLPEMPRGLFISLEIITTHHIMAHSCAVFSQISAAIVYRCTNQIGYILLFGNHFSSLHDFERKRKS